MRHKSKPRFGPAGLWFLITGELCVAQVTVGVGSGSVIAGGAGSENISLSATSGNAPASVQWTLTYSGSDLSGMSLAPAAAVTAAGKTLLYATGASSVECVICGTNTSPIPNGTIATASFDVSTSAATSSALLITGLVTSSPSATGLPASGVGATLTLIHLSTLACNPTH